MRYFEDFAPGMRFDLGRVTVTAEDIVRFAGEFDPQPFHVDPEAAESTSFKGLIASGWHTAALFMRLYVDTLLSDAASEGSPGVEQLRWLHPVRPGDTLTGTFTVADTSPSSTNPRRGTVLFEGEMRNQDDVAVLSMRGRGLFGRRPEEEGGA